MNRYEEIFQRFQQNNPSPQTELCFNSAFELLIAVILSAQATDKQVNKVTARLFLDAHTPEAIYALQEEGLQEYIRSINLYRNKAKYIIKTCKILIDEYHSQVPDNRKDLERLPGVGRKTANVILNVVFGEGAVAVDTHIFRVANRIGLAHASNPKATELQLLKVIPERFLKDAHHWLVLHGRYVCKAKNPACMTCFLNDLCEKGREEISKKLDYKMKDKIKM